ncbi:hypothetical protein KAU88_09610 [Candidatus Bathyarchaeota archaeon]|nr:hypothetical protein [Candidatus Bathyarchaeota archaeon]
MKGTKGKILSVISRLTIVLLLSVALLDMSNHPTSSVTAVNGPRTDDLIIRYYTNVEQAYGALKAGLIDIVGCELTADLYGDAINDANIVLAHVGDRGMCEFDLNNNHTIQSLSGIESPLFGVKRADFRKALALMTPKDLFVTECCGGFADRIDQPIAYGWRGWRNQSRWYEDGTYPYEYNPDAAATLLDAAGYVQGATWNPDWDDTLSWSAEYLRTYPSDHPTKPGVDLDDIEICIRNDDLRMFNAGNILLDIMLKMGIPCNPTYGALNSLYNKVMVNRDYHIYTGRWSLGRFPAISCYDLYNDLFWYPNGPNCVTGKSESNLGNYPILDSYLYDARFPPDYTTALVALKKALGYHVDMAINIPLWSTRSFWAWNSKLLGVVNMEGVGPVNDYTFMNAYRYDIVNGRPQPTNEPIRLGLCNAPIAMNIISSTGWSCDYQNLDRFNLDSGIETPPYDSSNDQTGFITGWTTSTWVDPDDSVTKSHITKTYRSDGYFTEPVTGNQGENVNTTHIYASVWYYYQVVDAWINPGVQDIKTLRIPDAGTIEYYWNVPGYWSTYQGSVYIQSFDWFTAGSISIETTETLTADATTGYLGTTDKVFWVKSAAAGATPLTLGVDYDIYMSDLSTNAADIRIINPTYYGQAITVTYLAVGNPYGYTPNNQPWNTILEGCGMYYVTGFAPGVGGGLDLKKNPHYWMETPVLGEIDFVRKPNGEFKVDAFDLVILGSAYGSQGIRIPDPSWFPGADLFPFGGVIDEFDAAVVVAAMSSNAEYHNVTLVDVTPLQTEVTSGTIVSISITVENPGDYTETFDVSVHANEAEVTMTEVTLSSGEDTTLELTWDTTGFTGSYTISAYAGPVDYERSLWDNILIDDMITVEPVEYTVVVKVGGQEHDIAVESDATLTKIRATRSSLRFTTSGPEGRTAYVNSTVPVVLNTTEIKVFVDGSRLTYPPFPIITTNGTHYFVYFEITLSTHEISIQQATPDAILENVSSLKTVIGQGYTSTFNVTIYNQGNFTKTFNVTVYADQNEILLGDEVIVDLQNVTLTAETSTIVIFTWNTTGEAKGNYIISATADDSMVYGWVIVTLPGDVDGDRDVDIYDIVQMAGIYGVLKPDPLYDPNCDIDGDGDIDIYDIVAAANNYGESW